VYTYEEMKQATGIPENELKNALKYLCNPKTKVIDKDNMKHPDF
jgi:cullin 3